MNSDDFVKHMPDDLKIEFVSWIAKRDRSVSHREFSRAFKVGYDHGWHDGQQGNERTL